mmetsp:Transcript_34350/g.80403  ORF Transcript_34350/g.80403 Transcript_34350/m.80403 type:complete len:203 (-) Transcript_34350:389-997(-)
MNLQASPCLGLYLVSHAPYLVSSLFFKEKPLEILRPFSSAKLCCLAGALLLVRTQLALRRLLQRVLTSYNCKQSFNHGHCPFNLRWRAFNEQIGHFCFLLRKRQLCTCAGLDLLYHLALLAQNATSGMVPDVLNDTPSHRSCPGASAQRKVMMRRLLLPRLVIQRPTWQMRYLWQMHLRDGSSSGTHSIAERCGSSCLLIKL